MEEVKLRRVHRLDSIRLDVKDSTYFTSEGYLVDHPILTSCGIFEYTNPDGSTRRELRLPEHVFAQESLKTYRGKPVIITHEAGVISKNNVDREQIGTILSDGYRDGDDVRAEIIIHDTDSMKACGLKELSLGYNLDLIEEPGNWNGEPYDAIQTNIVVNHLALVANARAGDQARLNIDGDDGLKGAKAAPISRDNVHLNPDETGFDGIKEEKGGKQVMATQEVHTDSMDMTPEELVEAIKMYKASKGGGAGADGTPPAKAEVPLAEETPPMALAQPPAAQESEKKDGDIQTLISAVEQLLAALKSRGGMDGQCPGDGDAAAPPAPEGGNTDNEDHADNADGAGDEAKSLNADSADEIFRQRLCVCRIGDKLQISGLENMSVADGKRAIIAKVLPGLRMDGKDASYLDAAYDLAVSEVEKRKDVSYQKRQMAGAPATRMDSGRNESMASAARQRMIDREGGNE